MKWPISLIVNKKSLTKYQILFRHLFFCKYVERALCTTHLKHKFTKEYDCDAVFSKMHSLRRKMLHFLQNFQYFVTVEVIEKSFVEFEQKMKTVKTIDDVMKCHNDFQDNCLKSCLLSVNIKLFQVISPHTNTHSFRF